MLHPVKGLYRQQAMRPLVVSVGFRRQGRGEGGDYGPEKSGRGKITRPIFRFNPYFGRFTGK